jgi:alkaline phosphatase D
MPSRRRLLRSSIALFGTPALTAQPATGTWLGPGFWGNRLQDWQRSGNRIECIATGPDLEIRTVGILDRELNIAPFSVSVLITRIDDTSDNGFAGFLIGAGAGKLDYRAAALVQRAGGEGGGLICALGADGRLRFLDHTSEKQPLDTQELPVSPKGKAPAWDYGHARLLRLSFHDGALHLTAIDPGSNAILAAAVLPNPDSQFLRGGLLLVSSHSRQGSAARFAFENLAVTGLPEHPQRRIDRVLGSLFSINGRVLRLSAQFMPLAASDSQTAVLEAGGRKWSTRIELGFVARFRVPDWDPSRPAAYQIVYDGKTRWSGLIPADPGSSRPLRIAQMSCIMAAVRTLDAPAFKNEFPEARQPGRYTHDALYFPHTRLFANVRAQQPDLLVFQGDQLYEGSPTRKDTAEAPDLDYLYKWYLFLWGARDLTRDLPAIVQTDDHDVFQGNIWGHGGRRAPNRVQDDGGYLNHPAWVNMVQRTQCGHNPDPFDASPIGAGIQCYYGAFRYGGVHFAILEDRKFKTARTEKVKPVLLGERQERFLETFASTAAGAPAIVLTQSPFACIQTSGDGGANADPDANGTPKTARDRAIALLDRANAISLAGDQHLASVVVHQTSDGTGVLQFASPGGGTSFQRWFQPKTELPRALSSQYTGDWVDGFGNRFRVLAVANPKVTQTHYLANHRESRARGLADRNWKSEGYGLIVVDHANAMYRLECWPYDADPSTASQFDGWPITWPAARTRPLFNGSDLTGWQRGGNARWTVEDGTLAGRFDRDRPGPGYVMTQELFEDVDLWLEFWTSRNGNSGVYVREPQRVWGSKGDERPGHGVNPGYEIQIDHHDPKNYTGSVYGIRPAAAPFCREEAWNTMRILCRGTEIKVWVNSHLVNHFQEARRRKGVVGFQSHGQTAHEHVVRFRNIRAAAL